MNDHPPAAPINKYGVLLAMLLGSFSVILNNSMMNVSIPFFMEEFGLKTVEAQNIILGFMIPMMITISLSAYLSDVYGKKLVYLIGMALFLSGSLFGTLAWDFQTLIMARAIQGIGGGIVMPLSIVILFSYFEKNERGFATGLWGVAVMVAPAIGPTIGGLLLVNNSWEMLFSINIPSGLFCIAATLYFIKEKVIRKKLKFDYIGFIAISIGVILLTVGINRLPNGGLEQGGMNAALIILGLLGIFYFVWTELHTSVPLIDIRVFKNPVFAISTMLVAVNTACLFSGMLLIPLLLQDVLKFNALTSGLVLLPQGIMMGVAMTISGRIVDRQGTNLIIPVGFMIVTAATFTIGVFIGESSFFLLMLLLVFRGIGIGFINTPATTAGLNALPHVQISRAMSINNVVRQLTGALTVTIFSMFYETRRTIYMEEMPQQEAGIMAIQHSFLLMGVIVLLFSPMLLKLNSSTRSLKREKSFT
ncbi:DHA2 family efflux MFS transporter permease subunit [Bacillus dakarensis]|uniref:DHA2 family efflux MFS transporter permease subunit n=1 Tax=Robertmurraya dakarensis TaxID=1926278 RepID=UPI0009815A9C|nr:DHA2 family efflux MFS transporter permease subunit [Bacillus dakarensis]